MTIQHAGKLTAGSLGSVTGGALEKSFQNLGVHPKLIDHLHGAGFFSNLAGAIAKGTKFIIDNKDTIAGVAKGARAGYDAYQSMKQNQKGGALKPKREQTKWSKLVTKITKQENCNVVDAINYIKEHNLYNP